MPREGAGAVASGSAIGSERGRGRASAATRWLGNALIALGLLLLCGVAASVAYSEWEQRQAYEAFKQEAAAREAPARAAPPRPSISARAAPPVVATPVDDYLHPEGAVPEIVPTTAPALSPPSAGATAGTTVVEPDYAEPTRIVLPSIGVDSRVVQVGIVAGEFEVPKFVVGHYVGTANVGEPGNAVMAGHVSSISSGNVFAKLDQLKPGDEIYLYGDAGPLTYRVTELRVVPNTEVSVMLPTPEPTLTLITCTGDWDWIAREYTHRLVAFATLETDLRLPQVLP